MVNPKFLIVKSSFGDDDDHDCGDKVDDGVDEGDVGDDGDCRSDDGDGDGGD